MSSHLKRVIFAAFLAAGLLAMKLNAFGFEGSEDEEYNDYCMHSDKYCITEAVCTERKGVAFDDCEDHCLMHNPCGGGPQSYMDSKSAAVSGSCSSQGTCQDSAKREWKETCKCTVAGGGGEWPPPI
jgi:hypothetical protein